MSLSVKGKLSRKLSVESGTSKAGKEWKKQSFLVDTGAQYNPEICFQLFGDEKIEILNHHNEGDQVEVSFNLSSKEYNGRYFHNIDAWRIENIGGASVSQDQDSPEFNAPSTEEDDLKADTSTLPDYTDVKISNMTAIGAGKDATSTHEDNNVGIEIRDNGAGQVWNSIFTEFAKSILDIEKTDSAKGTASTTGSGSYGSQALLENGVLAFKGNIFWNGGKGNTAAGVAEDDTIASDIIFATSNSNSFSVDPALIDDITADGTVSPFPDYNTSNPSMSGAATLADTSFLTQTTYRGAFAGNSASDNWMSGWTKLGEYQNV